ncbi:cryptochrome/photolyase family protein [Altererythrobacter lutimaris]|uniref:Deoxyribodipyrimidine photo-lyase n=1 Tax=Altererythrobacter lutimaris TaxID=2743979 RepID=A0A850H7N8_9SPHN|nr:deoxyribodipyrimidine photo-lyase [Altererythrobacter lutimaris]NVE93893.1 deoxyribodipyrimidine photo-lyase [Altererythrobacter lutimaris]
MSKPQIVWLRRDLRIADNPALYHAAKEGPVVAIYVLDDEAAGHHAYGGASRVWLHYALEDLQTSFGKHNAKIVLRRGDAVEELAAIANDMGADTVHANRHYEPWWRKAQGALVEKLDLKLYDGNYLLPPGSVTTGSGDPYKIYTPFSKATLEKLPPRDVLPEPETLSSPDNWPQGDTLEDWQLLPTDPDWAKGIEDHWEFTQESAHDRLEWWEGHIAEYDDARNLPSVDKVSQLSPYLHFGQISPVQIWHELKDKRSQGWTTFEKELIWRDYAQNVICQFPSYASESYREGWDDEMDWRDPHKDDEAARDLEAWQQGRTGYPIVDAGMRQLWQTGWMHNRVRMITASFLIKHLLIHWRHGEQWFWDTLVDADLASNATNWQWVAGTGVDSNMFSRIMAPLSQSEKFDAAEYIRTYVPELAGLDEPYIHDPEEHGCLPEDYPAKIIGHREARERALSVYQDFKN